MAKPWEPGGPSPNPGGRPKTSAKIKQYRQDGTDDEMLDIIIAIARDVNEDSRVRLAAADRVLDRLWGKPATVDLNGDTVKDNPVIQWPEWLKPKPPDPNNA